ncbi:MAG TPA: sugar phosphate isomerase/epimerase family protein, partial [Chthonomonadaceae bacterium]|nr:sugar phosphate isomerase/epimerase family protein [Chthonomonadaceae bacterium]
MRFGVCAGVEAAPWLADTGYDYIELSAAGDLIPDEEEEAWKQKRWAIEKMPLRAEAFNSFVRAGKIVGPEADAERLWRYVHRALSRAEEVGGAVIVFGSGGARNIPEGFPRETARRQLMDFLRFCADASDRTGVVVAIEPLHRAETNFIHKVREGAEIARILDREGVRCLADTYHMEQEDEPLSAIVASADVLAHVHTADTGRLAPGSGAYNHVAFFCTLRDADYDHRV